MQTIAKIKDGDTTVVISQDGNEYVMQCFADHDCAEFINRRFSTLAQVFREVYEFAAYEFVGVDENTLVNVQVV